MVAQEVVAALGDGDGKAVELNVGKPDSGCAANEGAALEVVAGEEPIAAQRPAQHRQGPGRERQTAGKGHRPPAGHLHAADLMVLQVAPDTRQLLAHLDTVRAQMIRGADPREHQELRAVEGAGAEDDFAPGTHMALPAFVAADDRDRVLPFEEYALGDAAEPDRQVGALLCLLCLSVRRS